MSCSPHRQQHHHHRRPGPPPSSSQSSQQSASSYRPGPGNYRRYRSPPPQRVSSTYRPGYAGRRPLTPPLASHRSGSPSPSASTYTASNGKSAYQRYPPSQSSRPPPPPPPPSSSSYDRPQPSHSQARPYRAPPLTGRDREERRGPVTPPLPGRPLPLAQRISGPPKSNNNTTPGLGLAAPAVKSEPAADDGGLPYGDDSDQEDVPVKSRKDSMASVQLEVKKEPEGSTADAGPANSAPDTAPAQQLSSKESSSAAKPAQDEPVKPAREATPVQERPPEPQPAEHLQPEHLKALDPVHQSSVAAREEVDNRQASTPEAVVASHPQADPGPPLETQQQPSQEKHESVSEKQVSPPKQRDPSPESQDALQVQPEPSPVKQDVVLEKQDASQDQPEPSPVKQDVALEKQDPPQQRPDSTPEKQDALQERQHPSPEKQDSLAEIQHALPEPHSPSSSEKRDVSSERQDSPSEKQRPSPEQQKPSPKPQEDLLEKQSAQAPAPQLPAAPAEPTQQPSNEDAPASPVKEEAATLEPPTTDMTVDDDPIQLLTAISKAAPLPVTAPVDSTTASHQDVDMAPATNGNDEIILSETQKEKQKAPETFDEVLLHVSAKTAEKAQDPEEALIRAFYQTLSSPKLVPQPESGSEAELPPKKRPKLNDYCVPPRPCAITYHLPLAYRQTHEILRPELEASFDAQNAKRQVHIDHLRNRYLKLHFAWRVHCERMERIKAAHDRTPLPPGTPFTTLEQIGWGPPAAATGSHSDGFPFPSPSVGAHGGSGGTSSRTPGGDVLASPQGPPGSATTPNASAAGGGSARQSRRSGGSGLGAVLSEAHFQDILVQLEVAESLDPKSRAAKSAATVPDMLAPDDAQRFVASFDNHNAQIEDVEEYYGISEPATSRADPCATEWSDEEVKTFLRRFAQHPKQFGKIAQDLPDKTVGQCVLFYYRSKRTIDFRSLVERKYAGGRKKKPKALLSKGSSSLLSEVQERSKTKAKRKAGADNGSNADEDANSNNSPRSPPATPSAAGSTAQATTFYNKRMLNQPIDNIGLGAQATQNVFHGSSKRAEMEAARAKRSKPPSAPALPQPEPIAEQPSEHPPSDSQQMAAEALAMLTGSLGSAGSIHNTSNSHDTDMDGGEYLPSTSSNGRGSSNLKSSTNSRLYAAAGAAANGDANKGKRRLHSSSYWSVQEKQDFLRLLAVHGKHWHSISAQITNKTPVQCRNYFANHHVKLGLDDIAARATGDASMVHDTESVPGTPDGVRVEPRGLAAAPIAETSMDIMPPSPEQPKISSRSNSSLQIRDLLNSADDNEDQTSGGGQTPGAAHDWFGNENDNEEEDEEAHEEGEEASDTNQSTDVPLPPPHVMYARPPPSAPPTGYFAAPTPMDAYGRSMPPMSAGMPFPSDPWGRPYSMPMMPPPAPAPAHSAYMRPPTMQQQDMLAHDRSQRGTIEREGDSRYYHSGDRFAPPPISQAGAGPLSVYPRRPFPAAPPAPPPASYPDYNSRFR